MLKIDDTKQHEQLKELRGCYIEAKRMGVDVRVPSWRDFTGETITKKEG